MSLNDGPTKSLLLSKAEAIGLLELCMISKLKSDPEKDRVMIKLSELVRHYLSDTCQDEETAEEAVR